MTTTGKLSERITPELAAKTASLLGWGIDNNGFLIHLLRGEEESESMFNRVADLLRVSEAMAKALRSVFSNIGKFDHASDMGNHYVRCKYCDVIGTFAQGKSTGHIPHKDDCLINIAEAALAEWEKLKK